MQDAHPGVGFCFKTVRRHMSSAEHNFHNVLVDMAQHSQVEFRKLLWVQWSHFGYPFLCL